MALLCRTPVPLRRLGPVGDGLIPPGILLPQLILGLGVARLRPGTEGSQACFPGLLSFPLLPGRPLLAIVARLGVGHARLLRLPEPAHAAPRAAGHAVPPAIADGQLQHILPAAPPGRGNKPGLRLFRILPHALAPGAALAQQLHGPGHAAVRRVAQMNQGLLRVSLQQLHPQPQTGLGMPLLHRHLQIALHVLLPRRIGVIQKVGRNLILGLGISVLRRHTPVGQRLLIQRPLRQPGLPGGGQQGRRPAVPLLRRQAQPLLRLPSVWLHTGPRQIAPAQLILDLRVVLISLQKVPKSVLFVFAHGSLLPSSRVGRSSLGLLSEDQQQRQSGADSGHKDIPQQIEQNKHQTKDETQKAPSFH